MNFYDLLFNSLHSFKNKIKKDSIASNVDVSSAVVGELTIISTVLIAVIMLRRLSILLTVLIILGLGVYLITNMPLITKFKKEQDDSIDKMMFYVVLTLGILVTVTYWGIIQ